MTNVTHNTYITECIHPFIPSHIHKIVKETTDKYMENPNRKLCDISTELAETVKDAVTASQSVPRHKLIVQCVSTENRDQALKIVSKSFCRIEDDNYTSYCWKNKNFVICVICFGLYYE